MCVSLASAILAGTIISLSEAIHLETGRQVFVLTYTNRVQHTGPVGAGNAMLLHFPARKMTRDCAIDTTAFATFADDLVEAVNPANHGARSFSAMMEPTRGAVDVFDVGAYTVVLAERAGDIPAALARVPEKRRPKLNQAIFDWYERQFPDNSFALCCFDARTMVKAAPLMFWYEPNQTDRLMLPGLDAHTGAPPDLKARVDLDHWIILGTRERKHQYATEVDYTDEYAMPPLAKALLPRFVIGRKYTRPDINGDFVGPLRCLQEGPGYIERGLLVG